MKSKRGLIVGGAGALGSAIVTDFRNHGWKLLNIDYKANLKAN